MAKKNSVVEGKKRTREHIIADLAVNHVEWHILRCEFTAERVEFDYGYDLIMTTFTEQGHRESGQVYLQIKSTDDLKLRRDRATVSMPIDRRDLKLWLREPYPVILVVYDAATDRAYWLYVQEYFQNRSTKSLFASTGSITLHVPVQNRLNRTSVRRFQQYRDEVESRFLGRK